MHEERRDRLAMMGDTNRLSNQIFSIAHEIGPKSFVFKSRTSQTILGIFENEGLLRRVSSYAYPEIKVEISFISPHIHFRGDEEATVTVIIKDEYRRKEEHIIVICGKTRTGIIRKGRTQIKTFESVPPKDGKRFPRKRKVLGPILSPIQDLRAFTQILKLAQKEL